MKADHAVRSYAEWEVIRKKGCGGKKKIRRDTTLAKREDGLLTFTYGDSELLATLAPDNTYTLSMDNARYGDSELLATLAPDNTYTISMDNAHFYPTYSNIFQLIAKVSIYNDSSHYKNYKQTIRVFMSGVRWGKVDGKWAQMRNTIPFTNGLQFRHGVCLNPEIAVDYKRKLNRELSLPLLRKTETLAKILRVATRMDVLERDTSKRVGFFRDVNLDDPTAADAEIILRMGNSTKLRLWQQTPENLHAALMRCAENGLADYREWLYKEHGCYEMVPIVYTNETPEV